MNILQGLFDPLIKSYKYACFKVNKINSLPLPVAVEITPVNSVLFFLKRK